MMRKINRRDFLKFSAASLGALALAKTQSANAYLPEFPADKHLGRTFNTVEIKSKPDPESSTVKTIYDDYVLPLYGEVIGKPFASWSKKRVWYETPDGFIPANSVQPVRNEPNVPLTALPKYGSETGMWAEVTVPYADLIIDGDTRFSPRLQETTDPRFYFSQVLWIDGIQESGNGDILYHMIEKHGSYGDKYWADARAFRPITPEDISPINPEIEDKYISVDVDHQTMSCYENGQEILFTRVSTGAKYDFQGRPTDKYLTPPGDYHAINRKYISLHMAGGEASKASGYEEFAVSWTSIFAAGGVAIHSTHFHNMFGEPQSHGCVNAPPDVAKFIFRWTLPDTPYDPGKIEIEGYSGTNVKVVDHSVTENV
jgi:lipoprotein-anchoring transpeptidase ErfK/SrfK